VIEGIGRSRVEPGFLFEIVDEVVEVPDAASIAAAWQLDALLGRRYGGSSGTNFVACLQLAASMRARGECGSIVSLLCDRGERYDETLFDAAWLARQRLDPAPWRARIAATCHDGHWRPA
jgi:cysteine synthase